MWHRPLSYVSCYLFLVAICCLRTSESHSVMSNFFATPWTIQSTKFPRTEYCSGYPFPSPGNPPNPGIKPRSPTLQADSLPAEPQGNPNREDVVCKKVKVRVPHLCPTLCDPMDYRVHGILQARILEWIAFSFSTGSS